MAKVSEKLLYLCIFVTVAAMLSYVLEGDLAGAAGIGLSAYLVIDYIRKLEGIEDNGNENS